MFLGIFAVLAPAALCATLSGHVTHSETLDPLTEQEEIGKLFENTALFKKMQASRLGKAKKFLIPAWLAGTWDRTESTETSRMELPSGRRLQASGTGTARVTDKFGSYRDRLGLIWQVFEPANALGRIDRGDSVDYHVVSNYDLMALGQASVIVQVQAWHAVVDKKTNKVVSAYQDEELNTYTSISGNFAKTDSSVKMFDLRGKPIFLTRAVSSEKKIAPFTGEFRAEGESP